MLREVFDLFKPVQILFFGGEVTKVYASRKGIVPAPKAVRVTEQVQA